MGRQFNHLGAWLCGTLTMSGVRLGLPLLDINAGIADVEGDEFRRVDGVQLHGRGGMLGWASVLAKHSGASRSSFESASFR